MDGNDDIKRQKVLLGLQDLQRKFDALSPADLEALEPVKQRYPELEGVIARTIAGSMPTEEARRWLDATVREIEKFALGRLLDSSPFKRSPAPTVARAIWPKGWRKDP